MYKLNEKGRYALETFLDAIAKPGFELNPFTRWPPGLPTNTSRLIRMPFWNSIPAKPNRATPK